MTLKRSKHATKCSKHATKSNKHATIKKRNKYATKNSKQNLNMAGGTLFQHETFKKILSIGYEFECTEVIKFSLHNNNNILINSDLSLRYLKERMDNNIVKQKDKNYLEIDENAGQPDELELTTEEKMDYEGNSGHFEIDNEEYNNERQNDKYLVFFYENREGDGDNVKFQVTNDLAVTSITKLAKPICKELHGIPKNEMYYFKTTDTPSKIYDIHFSKKTFHECETFSDLEYVITYYNPNNYENIILDTFVDACSRIVDHFSDLEYVTGDLYIKTGTETGDIVLGTHNRQLYHKPGTNLYYMDAFDYEAEDIYSSCFIPQMTFRSKAIDCLEIMKQIVKSDESYEKNKNYEITIKAEEYVIHFLEKMVNDLFEKYNETAPPDKQIHMDDDTYNILKCYVFFIFYKLFGFIYFHTNILMSRLTSDISYLKDFLFFNCRHHNNVLYEHIKQILKEKYNITDVGEIKKIFIQPSIVEKLYKRTYNLHNEDEAALYEFDYDADAHGKYKYNFNAFKEELPDTNKHFGNPLFSFASYFDYLEKNESDWLFDNEYDQYSTVFPIVDNVVMVEYRIFKYSVISYLNNNIKDIDIVYDCLTINNMHTIVNNELFDLDKARVNTILRMDEEPIHKRRIRRRRRSKKVKTSVNKSNSLFNKHQSIHFNLESKTKKKQKNTHIYF